MLNIIDLYTYEEAIDNDLGWCSFCKEFTNSNVEPDAENYICEECGNDTVFGAENALIMGMFVLDQEEEDE